MPCCLQQDDLQVIAYSMPLIGSDGKPFGVIGVEVTLDYLRRQLPYDELLADKAACMCWPCRSRRAPSLPSSAAGRSPAR